MQVASSNDFNGSNSMMKVQQYDSGGSIITTDHDTKDPSQLRASIFNGLRNFQFKQ